MRRLWASFIIAVAFFVVAALAPLPYRTAPEASGSPHVGATIPSTAPEDFPVTVTTADGKVTVPAKPVRILCLSASATQMLYSIGAGKQVVGVDKYSTWPPGTPRTNFTGYESSAEDYLYLHPDLVIFAFSEGSLVKQLRLLHIPALVLPPASNFAGVDNQIDELGLATGHMGGAKELSASLAAFLASAVRKAGNLGRGASYYVELSPDYYTATSKTFIGAELGLFGMRDIADPASHGTGYPQISAEYVLKENPEYVFLADTVCCHQTPATFSRRAAFSYLSAVKEHHVFGVNDSVASQWGPHTVEEFVGFLARVLQP